MIFVMEKYEDPRYFGIDRRRHFKDVLNNLSGLDSYALKRYLRGD